MDHANGEYKTIFDGLLDGYKGIAYGIDDEGTEHDDSCTMKKIVIKDGKVVSVSGELPYLKNEIIAILGESSDTVIKTDSKTNIKLETLSEIIPNNIIMCVTEIASGETFNQIKSNLPKVERFKAFDITLKENGANIQPNGKVKISIPIPTGFDASRLIVYRIEENGDKTEFPVTVENGYSTFETDHFSTYVLGEKTELTEEIGAATEKKDDKLPQTGEKTNTFARWLSIAVALGIFWICSMLLIEYEKKKMAKR